jgi:hypothetical protein
MQKRKEDVIVSREVTLSSWKIISTEIIIQKPINLSWYSKTKTLLFYVSVQYEFLQRNCGRYFLPELSSLLDLLTLFLWRSFPICGSLQDDLSWSRRNCRKWTCLETYAEKKDDVWLKISTWQMKGLVIMSSLLSLIWTWEIILWNMKYCFAFISIG